MHSRNRLARRGSMQDSGLALVAAAGRDFKCPKCKQYYEQPKILPCGHRMCVRCIEYLQMRPKEKIFHCPVPKCSQPCATIADNLRTDQSLEQAVQHRKALDSPRCQRSGCGSTDIVCDRCPHCEQRLCRDHFAEDSELVGESCRRKLEETKEMTWEVQAELDRCELLKNNLDNQIQENKASSEHLKMCIDRHSQETEDVLLSIKKDVEASENSLREFYQKIREMEGKVNEVLMIDEDDADSLQDKQCVINAVERLAKNKKLPNLPDDIRFNKTPADMEAIEESIKELKVLQTSLEVQTVEDRKLTIKCPEQNCRPHHAVLWCHTENFCVSSSGEIQRRTSDRQEKLPDEVLLVSNTIKLFVLTTDGQRLGQIEVKESSPFVVNWFDVSPDGGTLALLSTNERKVLLCNMDGSVRYAVGQDNLPGFQCLCSVALGGKCLMIVDAGNARQRKPGAVWLLEGPRFDPGQARRIPLQQVKRRIFPKAVTQARGSYFLLATKASPDGGESASNELLMHDKDCEFVAEVCPDELDSAQQICSDSVGRIFVSVSRRSSTSEVIVLDPQGRRIASVRDAHMASCNGISRSESRGRPSRLVVCDPENRLVHVYQLA